jgi:DNA-binding LacI/PurR family transcriptional regulator
MIARTLQGKRMQTVGVLLPELGEGYHSQVLSGVGDLLMREGFFISLSITVTEKIWSRPILNFSDRAVWTAS